MRKNVLLLLMLLNAFTFVISAQTHTSVSLNETELYNLLEMAEIRGLIHRLPSARPYSRSMMWSTRSGHFS